MRVSSSSSEKRRLAEELTVAQKGLGALKTRISNMNALSSLTAKSAAEERAAAEQKLAAEQQTIISLKVRLCQMVLSV